jgi:drug/metabolite transporter (DMT)-like permease
MVPTYVLATLFSSLCFACGMALQKTSVAKRGVGGALGSTRWQLGLGIIGVAAALQALAISLGDVSVVKPLGLVQCVLALGIGVLLLGERIGRAEAVGSCAIVAGGVLLASDGGSAARVGQTAGAGIRVLGVTAAALAVPLLLLRAPRRNGPELPLALAAGVLFGSGDTLLKVAFESARTQLGTLSVWGAGALGAIASRPEFHLFLVGYAAGLLLHQLAYRGGRIAVIAPVSAVTSAALPAVLGAAILGEPLGGGRAAGVALLLGGGAWVGSASARVGRPAGRSSRPGARRTTA